MGNCLKTPTADDISLLHEGRAGSETGDSSENLGPPPPYQVGYTFSRKCFPFSFFLNSPQHDTNSCRTLCVLFHEIFCPFISRYGIILVFYTIFIWSLCVGSYQNNHRHSDDETTGNDRRQIFHPSVLPLRRAGLTDVWKSSLFPFCDCFLLV